MTTDNNPASPLSVGSPSCAERGSATTRGGAKFLQTVLSNAECARAELPEGHPAQVFMQEIVTATRRALSLTTNAAGTGCESAGLLGQVLPHSADGRHILVVDDEIDVGGFTARMVREIGYEASLFGDPAAALEFFAADPNAVDLIVTDFCMPHLSGADLIERAKALRPDLPVVVTTGFSDALEADHPFVTSTCQVLRKPFDAMTLAHTVRGILSGAKRKEKRK